MWWVMIVLSRHWNWCRWCQSSTTSTKLNRNMEQPCLIIFQSFLLNSVGKWVPQPAYYYHIHIRNTLHFFHLRHPHHHRHGLSPPHHCRHHPHHHHHFLEWLLNIIRICICLVNREVEDFRRTFVEARLWVANSLQLCYQASCATRPKKSCDVQARGSRETTWNCQIFIASAGVMITSWWIEYELHHMILIYFAKSSRDAIEIVFTSTLNCR